MFDDENNGKINWVSKVRDMLCNLGFNEVWINQDPCTVSFKNIKIRINDKFLQSWNEGLHECNKLCIYRQYKLSFGIEKFYCNFALLT